MINCNPRISTFFGLPKTHKKDISFRPINYFRNSVNYKLVRTLNKIISIANPEWLKFTITTELYFCFICCYEPLQKVSIPEAITAVKERVWENGNWKIDRFRKLEAENETDLLSECIHLQKLEKTHPSSIPKNRFLETICWWRFKKLWHVPSKYTIHNRNRKGQRISIPRHPH